MTPSGNCLQWEKRHQDGGITIYQGLPAVDFKQITFSAVAISPCFTRTKQAFFIMAIMKIWEFSARARKGPKLPFQFLGSGFFLLSDHTSFAFIKPLAVII